jgi:hypothetical protein
MVDEQQLAEMFRAAAADAPPATFDEHDVASASRRITARHRSLVTGGSALAGVVLVVGLVVGFLGVGHTGGGSSSAASAPAAGVDPGSGSSSSGMDRARPMLPDGGTGFSTSTPKQGGIESGETGSNPAGCGPTDGKLAVALANELPSVGAGTQSPDSAVPATIDCPAGSRSAGYQLRVGTTVGTVGVILLPADSSDTDLRFGPDVVKKATPAAGGGTLVEFSQPAAGSSGPPLADQLDRIGAALAGSF